MRLPWTGKETCPGRGQLISLNLWMQAGSRDNLRVLTMQMRGWKPRELLVPSPTLSPENGHTSDSLHSV